MSDQMSCQTMVELVTAYLEDDLPGPSYRFDGIRVSAPVAWSISRRCGSRRAFPASGCARTLSIPSTAMSFWVCSVAGGTTLAGRDQEGPHATTLDAFTGSRSAAAAADHPR